MTGQAAGLPVRTRTPVTAVESQPPGFLVSTPDGDASARTVVLASGLLNVPRRPAQAARVASRVHQLHAADYRSAAQLADGAVLVVGGGQSGCQIAEDLASAGRTVYLSTSRVGRIPWLYRGRESLAWLVDCGFWDQRPQDLPEPGRHQADRPAAGGRAQPGPAHPGRSGRTAARPLHLGRRRDACTSTDPPRRTRRTPTRSGPGFAALVDRYIEDAGRRGAGPRTGAAVPRPGAGHGRGDRSTSGRPA